MADDKKDLEKFLSKVDEIGSIMKELNANDEDVRFNALQKADHFIEKANATSSKSTKEKKYQSTDTTGVNRSSINQKAFDSYDSQSPNPNVGAGTMDQDAFMAMMESDAKERHERKKIATQEANQLKEQGNVYFKEGDYQKAIDIYTKGMEKAKDVTALYTNRAQAYIKVGEYQKAVADCDWALRVFENCLKAHIHKGKALMALGDYDAAVESFEAAMRCDPSKETVIQDYIAEVERARQTAHQEAAAADFLASGQDEAKGLVHFLEKMYKDDQLPMYYSGGLRVIANLLKHDNDRTLFRTKKGLSLTKDHKYISKCFCASPRSLSREELDICSATLDALKAACTEMDENCRQLLDVESLAEQIVKFLESQHKACRMVQESAINLLYKMSHSEVGRSAITNKFDIPRLLTSLFLLMRKNSSIAVSATSFLNNLALDKRLKSQLRGNIEETMLPAFETLVFEGSKNPAVLPSCVGTMTNLCGDPVIRRRVVARPQCWQACCKALEMHKNKHTEAISEEMLYATLGLLMNMTFETSDHCKPYVDQISQVCVPLVHCGKAGVEERALRTLGHLLPHYEKAVTAVVHNGIVPNLLSILKRDASPLTKPAVKCLTACTQHSESAKHEVVKEKGLGAIVSQLKHEEEVVFGNAALCLSSLTSVPKVCEKLTKTNIVQHLLVLARDGRKHTVQHNCAILLAKLAQGDPRHLERLRELNGIEILHDVMKHMK